MLEFIAAGVFGQALSEGASWWRSRSDASSIEHAYENAARMTIEVVEANGFLAGSAEWQWATEIVMLEETQRSMARRLSTGLALEQFELDVERTFYTLLCEELLACADPQSQMVTLSVLGALAARDAAMAAERQRRIGADIAAYLRTLLEESRGRTIALFEVLDVPRSKAEELANSEAGTLEEEVENALAAGQCVILEAPLGFGKSLACERTLQRAILNRLAEASAPLPVFSAAKALSDVNELCRDARRKAGVDDDCSVLLIVDGFDELPSSEARARLVTELLGFGRAGSNTVVLASRPDVARFPQGIPRINPRRLDSNSARRLVAEIREEKFEETYIPIGLSENIECPLVAILFAVHGLYLDNGVRLSSWALLEKLIGNAIRERLSALGILRLHSELVSLALHSIGPRVFPLQSIQIYRETELLETRLVSRDEHGTWEFALPAFVDWFAAEAFAAGGELEPETLAELVANDLAWMGTARMFIVCEQDETRVDRMLIKLAALDAGAAITVMDGLLNFGVASSSRPRRYEATDFGEHLLVAYAAWQDAFARLLARVEDFKRPPSRAFPNRRTVAISITEPEGSDRYIVHVDWNPVEPSSEGLRVSTLNPGRANGLLWHSFSFLEKAKWWQWSLDDLKEHMINSAASRSRVSTRHYFEHEQVYATVKAIMNHVGSQPIEASRAVSSLTEFEDKGIKISYRHAELGIVEVSPEDARSCMSLIENGKYVRFGRLWSPWQASLLKMYGSPEQVEILSPSSLSEYQFAEVARDIMASAATTYENFWDGVPEVITKMTWLADLVPFHTYIGFFDPPASGADRWWLRMHTPRAGRNEHVTIWLERLPIGRGDAALPVGFRKRELGTRWYDEQGPASTLFSPTPAKDFLHDWLLADLRQLFRSKS